MPRWKSILAGILGSALAVGPASAVEVTDEDMLRLFGLRYYADEPVVMPRIQGGCLFMLTDMATTPGNSASALPAGLRKDLCRSVLNGWLAIPARNPKALSIADLESPVVGQKVKALMERQRNGRAKPSPFDQFGLLFQPCEKRASLVKAVASRGFKTAVPPAPPEICAVLEQEAESSLAESRGKPSTRIPRKWSWWIAQDDKALLQDIQTLEKQLAGIK